MFLRNIAKSFQNEIVDIKQSHFEKFTNTTKHNKICIMILVNRKYCRNLHNYQFINALMQSINNENIKED